MAEYIFNCQALLHFAKQNEKEMHACKKTKQRNQGNSKF